MFTNREDLAWCAGFLDGEAHWGAAKSQNGYATLSVSQVDRDTLVHLQQCLGLGLIYGPTRVGEVHRQPIYKWQTLGFERVQAVTAMVWPWLQSPKRKQATMVLLKARQRPSTRRSPEGRGRAKERTHCPQGHPYDKANTYIDKLGKRMCRQCGKERGRRYRAAKHQNA